MKEVLNGGYNVHPVPPPNSEIKERIRKRYERERIKIEKLLNRLGISFQCLAQRNIITKPYFLSFSRMSF